MNLRDKAAGAGGGPDVVLAGDLDGIEWFVLRSFELEPADEITPEGQFPEFGDFLPIETSEGEEMWAEVPGSLAEMIVAVIEEAEVTEQESERVTVAVDMAAKSSTGEWRFIADVSVE